VKKQLNQVKLEWNEIDKVKVWEGTNLLSSPTTWSASNFGSKKTFMVEGVKEGEVWFTLKGIGRIEIVKIYPDGTKLTEIQENVMIASDRVLMTIINNVLLTIHPDEPSELSADDGEAFIVLGIFVYNQQTKEWEEVNDGTQVQWELMKGEGNLYPTNSSTQGGFAVTKLITNRKAGTNYQTQVATLL